MSQTKAQLISPVGDVVISGIVTATSFSGNLTGTATTATTATIATNARGLTDSPNINVGVATVSGLGGVAYVAITTTSTNKTLVNREYCTVVSTTGIGTTAGITVTLPSTPSPGWEVGVAVGGTFTDTIVARNGNNIMGLSEDMTLDRGYLSFQFVYVSSSVGWRFF